MIAGMIGLDGSVSDHAHAHEQRVGARSSFAIGGNAFWGAEWQRRVDAERIRAPNGDCHGRTLIIRTNPPQTAGEG